MQKIAVGAVAAVAVMGAGAGVAATKLRSPEQESKAVLNDVAGQLGVTPERLTNAFKTALKNRVDQAVKDGRLTKAEGDRIKAEIDRQGLPLLGPGFRHHGPGGFRIHRAHHGLEDAATYLGMTEAALRTQLENGKTLAQVAKDRGKSVDGLVDALVAEKRAHIQEHVKEGRLTQAQANEFLQGIRARVTDMVNGRFAPAFGHGFRRDGERPAPSLFLPTI